jgi:translocation and assembly module TamB
LPIKLDNGVAIFDGTVTGKLDSPVIAGHLSVTSLVYEQEKVDSLTADIALDRSGAQIRSANMARGTMQAQFAGSVGLRNWRLDDNGAVTATAAIRNADVKDLLALANQKTLPITGMLNTSANVSGTVGNLHIALDLNVTNGSIYDEPFDRLTAKVDYAGNAVEVASAQLTAGPKQVNLKASYEHAANNLMNGRLRFQVTSNSMPVNQFQIVRKYRPDALGNLQLNASGVATVSKLKSGQTNFQLAALNADVTGHGLQVEQKKVGDVHLIANTTGETLNARLELSIANSNVRGEGQWRLEGDYPGSAEVTFSKLDFAALRAWLASPKSSFNVEGSAEGKLSISGPALKPEVWKAALDIPQFQITPLPGTGREGNPAAYTLRNSGPIRLIMENSIINIQNARFIGRETDVTVTGNISLKAKNPLDARVNGTLDLALLQDFSRDLTASGKVVADASIRGALTQPQLNGSLQLQNANFSYAGLPNGLSNATGLIRFDGNRAQIETLTAESGGGKIRATGFAALAAGGTAFRIDVTANQVRVRYPEGVSTVADATLNISGTTERSLLSGSVTILRTGFNPRTDFGSILARSAEPVRTASVETGLLGGMQFDVQIETAPDVTFQTDIAQDLQAEANLRLRGTPNNPVLIGRINITQGDLTFFGNKYTINQGSISFYNPVKLEPILNIDLETKARGVDVTLTLSGPINKLNVSYRSDPPLQFSEIVALLATGRSPTSDPSLVASRSGAPQSWQQMGASALVGQALASPVAGRLQRLFGVSKIKIDPLLTGVDNPQARLTIEQQVTPEITFTYITNLSNSNPQVIRIEWSVNKQWSAVALREENGWFGVDFLYKKRFK